MCKRLVNTDTWPRFQGSARALLLGKSMKLRIAALVPCLITLGAAAAQAQEQPRLPEAPPKAESAATEPAPTASTPASVPPQPQPAAKAPPGTGVACIVDNFGIDPASARTAGRMLCDEIRSLGVVLNADGVPGSESYRVSFERLGSQLIARLSYEAPTGNVVRSRRLVLKGPEEITVAAPRLAAAVVRDQELDDSQKVDNLVGQETRKYEKKSGEFLWGVGLAAISGPTAGAFANPGLEVLAYYETPRVAFGFSGRMSVGDGSGPDFNYAGLGLGARYFLSETNTSAFVGGGLSVSYIEVSDDSDSRREGSGLGGFGEVGAEFLRLHGSRLILSARVEAPFYAVKDEWAYDSAGNPVESNDSEYHLPISVALAYAW